jgi:hypothetical protein
VRDTARFVVSRDGKTLTMTVLGSDGKTKNVFVFDKQ